MPFKPMTSFKSTFDRGHAKVRLNNTTFSNEYFWVKRLCFWPLISQDFKHVISRTGRVRELTKYSPLKFKMVWHQFSKVQCPNYQFVWNVRSVQFGARRPSASIQYVQFSSFSLFNELF